MSCDMQTNMYRLLPRVFLLLDCTLVHCSLTSVASVVPRAISIRCCSVMSHYTRCCTSQQELNLYGIITSDTDSTDVR